jgi:glycosidase
MQSPMTAPLFPSLYQINTRVLISELSRKLGHPATLDDIPSRELDRLANAGFDWIWFLSVWQTGKEGQRVSREHAGWRMEFQDTLHDLTEEDIGGSGFAITSYNVHEQLGGNPALARLRERLKNRGLKLMLDFVPNHSAMDHEWARSHPDFYIHGNESILSSEPANYTRIKRESDQLILAHGRDPYFPGWPDTLQLNYGNPVLQQAMTNELLRISDQCDGVRCDMAMLVLPEVFERTWSLRSNAFWPEVTGKVREKNPEFCFMAEVYWDLEWTLQQQGFDYTYDKRLYDRLKEGKARPVREHFRAGMDYQRKLARFLENHDEPRAAVEFPPNMHEAAAVITFLSPGLRFFHQGQFQGKKKRISPHLCRGPEEPANKSLEPFYEKLLAILRRPVFRSGTWQLLECAPAWDGNWTHDCYVSFGWEGNDGEKMLVAINYASNQSQGYLKLPFPDLSKKRWRLHDLFSGVTFEREGDELLSKGLYLDEPPWKFYVLSFRHIG